MVPGVVRDSHSCPALFVSAPASGQGKTTVVAAIARRYRRNGRDVRVFKTGPDFLDPMILEHASGRPVVQLDLWMGGMEDCRRSLYDAAAEADLILVEGGMGLFDGKPSSADLAVQLGMPVLAVVDGAAMAQTFGAVVLGLARYRDDVDVVGVVANRVAGEYHYGLLAESLPEGVRSIGWLPRQAEDVLPERHLGLVQAAEIADLDERMDRVASALIFNEDALPAPTTFPAAEAIAVPRRLVGTRIGVARDQAFSFLYRANLDVLERAGATLVFFSPLRDGAPPDVDALYLPGGYPELYLRRLEANRGMREAVRAHHRAGKPIVAECGGLLYLAESLTDVDGHRGEMAGVLPGHATMQKSLTAIAYQRVTLPEGELRGHTFHHSRLEIPLEPIARGVCPNGGRTAEAVYRRGRLTASYVHHYYPSNPEAAVRLFEA